MNLSLAITVLNLTRTPLKGSAKKINEFNEHGK